MSYQNIKQITSYEIKMLTRNWGFLFIALFSMALVTYFQLTAQGNIKPHEWIAISLPSAIPFANAYLVNYLQVLITVFFAGRFIRKEQRMDTNASIDIRPFSNTEYLWGKTLGFTITLLGLDILLGVIAMTINLFLSDAPFALYPYVFYFLTLTLPTLVFITGLSIFMKGVIQNQAISLVILLGVLYLEFMYASNFFHGTIDMFASPLPNALSEITGFSELGLYLLHRLSFFSWGCGLLTLGVLSINRVSNNHSIRKRATVAGTIILLLGIIPAGAYVNHFAREQQRRDSLHDLFVKYEKSTKARITKHNIQFEQKETSYRATSQLSVINPEDRPLGLILLYLNPGLKVSSMTIDGQTARFSREEQIIILEQSLQPEEMREITLQYEGTIHPQVCYTEIDDFNTPESARKYSIFNFGKDFFYLQPNFTVLTPECLWYPTSLPTVNIGSPHTTLQNYTRFQLSVIGEKERTPISQGAASTHGDTTRFTNAQNLAGISLCIGNYTRKAVGLEGQSYEIYVFKGHEYLVDQFTDPLELFNYWQGNYRDGNKKYVFPKLAFVETPVHFCAYSRPWKDASEYLQPELIFRPEREALSNAAFKVPSQQINEGMSAQLECFNNYIQNYYKTRKLVKDNIFVGKYPYEEIKNEYDFSFLERKNHFFIYSPEFLGINLLFQKIQTQWKTTYRNPGDYVTCRKAIQYLDQRSLDDALLDTEKNKFLDEIIWSKSNYFLKYLLCFIPYEELHDFTSEFIARHPFQEIHYEQYCKEIQERWDIDLLAFTHQLYTQRELPSFRVKDAYMQWVEKDGEKSGYVESVKIWNQGKVDGIITLASSDQRNAHYLIPAGTCKEVRHYYKEEPREFNLEVQTNLAKNRPAYFSFKNITPEGSTRDPHPGVFDTDTTPFSPQPDEYIVDDNDPGFHIVEDKRPLKNASTWLCDDSQEGYGEVVRTYHFKRTGKGNSKIEWETQLPESGNYELFVYNNGTMIERAAQGVSFVNRKKVEKKDPIHTYLFKHEAGEEKIKLEVLNLGEGWVSLGKYHFIAGPVKITQTDEGADAHQKIFADAVKWVKQ